MIWSYESPPSTIAIRATLADIDEAIATSERCLRQTDARILLRSTPRDIGVRESIERRLTNLREARRLWIDDHRRTET